MSVKGTIYKEITDHLNGSDADDNPNVPGLQWVDKDRGQLDDPGNFVFPRPAVFISFGIGQYENKGGGILKGQKILRVRTCYENYADSHTGSVNQEKALAYFEFDEAVHKALEGLSGTYFDGLTKTADEDDLDHTNLIVQLMEYTFNLVDDSAGSKKDLVLVDPDPNVVVEKVAKDAMPVKVSDSPVIIPEIKN